MAWACILKHDPYQRESCKQSPFTVWLIKRKRVLITVMRNAWIPQPTERHASQFLNIQELIRARGFLTDPKQHTRSLLLNASWHFQTTCAFSYLPKTYVLKLWKGKKSISTDNLLLSKKKWKPIKSGNKCFTLNPTSQHPTVSTHFAGKNF